MLRRHMHLWRRDIPRVPSSKVNPVKANKIHLLHCIQVLDLQMQMRWPPPECKNKCARIQVRTATKLCSSIFSSIQKDARSSTHGRMDPRNDGNERCHRDEQHHNRLGPSGPRRPGERCRRRWGRRCRHNPAKPPQCPDSGGSAASRGWRPRTSRRRAPPARRPLAPNRRFLLHGRFSLSRPVDVFFYRNI